MAILVGMGIGDRGLAIRDWRSGIGDRGLAIRDWRSGIGDQGLATGDWRQGIGDRGLAIGNWWTANPKGRMILHCHMAIGDDQSQIFHLPNPVET